MPHKQFSVFKLEFPSPIHVSSGGFGLEQADTALRSDTLFSALCHTTGLLWGDQMVKEWINQAPFRISSCFPYIGTQLYFPKPVYLNAPDRQNPKDWKKVRYLSEDLLKVWLEGGSKELHKIPLRIHGAFCSAVSTSDSAETKLIKEHEIPRVTVDRLTQAGSIFHFAQHHYYDQTGLFFMVDWGNATQEQKMVFKSSLSLLADEGLGADRTVGKGWFNVNVHDEQSLSFEIPNKADCHFLLSLYHPSCEDLAIIDPENSFYELTTRRGWVSQTNLKRQSTRFITEGSLMYIPTLPEGDNPVVFQQSPDYQVIRYGKALSIPIHPNT